jgi:prevent-host-death family protein
MKEVPVYEAKTKLSELLVDVERGEPITITRRGKPVARLIAAEGAERGVSAQRQQVAATIGFLRKQRRGVVLEGDLKALISSGAGIVE